MEGMAKNHAIAQRIADTAWYGSALVKTDRFYLIEDLQHLWDRERHAVPRRAGVHPRGDLVIDREPRRGQPGSGNQ